MNTIEAISDTILISSLEPGEREPLLLDLYGAVPEPSCFDKIGK